MQEYFEIVRQAQADALRARPQYLAPFVHGEASVAQAARALDVPLPRLHYWVGRYVDAQLLISTRTEKRAGRPITYFKAAADRFHIPSEFLDEHPSADLLRLALEEFLKVTHPRVLGPGHDQWIEYREGEKDCRIRVHPAATDVPRRSKRPAHWLTSSLHLTDDEAQSMLNELRDTVHRYSKLHPDDESIPTHQLLMTQASSE